jgi:hypothetical protein
VIYPRLLFALLPLLIFSWNIKKALLFIWLNIWQNRKAIHVYFFFAQMYTFFRPNVLLFRPNVKRRPKWDSVSKVKLMTNILRAAPPKADTAWYCHQVQEHIWC